MGDVVGAITRIVHEPDAIGQVYKIGSTEEVSIYELAKAVRRITGTASEIVRIPYDQAYEAGFEDMARRVPDLTKAAALIGYRPTRRLEEILELVINHERAAVAATQ